MELNGVRGGHLADPSTTVHAAWETSTGRPDVTIAVLDSGIKWNDDGAMSDLRFKVRLNLGELPQPQVGGPIRDTSIAPDCSGYSAGGYDVNGDGVVNLRDYACDPRVSVTDHHEGPAGTLTPQDLIVAFSDHAPEWATPDVAVACAVPLFSRFPPPFLVQSDSCPLSMPADHSIVRFAGSREVK